MAYDTLIDKAQEEAKRRSLADHIRAKSGTTARMEWGKGFEDAVDAIPTGGNCNAKFGVIKYPSDQIFTTESPIVINHNLGKTPTFFAFFSNSKPMIQSGYFYFISAVTETNGVNSNASYYSGAYPELATVHMNGSISDAERHNIRSAAVDVWGATDTQIKVGAARMGQAKIPGGYEYTWIVGTE